MDVAQVIVQWELAHENFDVFLDHFRISPGVDFQVRLTQELGDKSMVLLLESKGILDSEWTLYEINVAKTCGLGIFALQPPGGKSVPGVVIGLSRLMEPLREQRTGWLAGLCKIELIDEGRLKDAAAQMARGEL